jgi:hypothetical protein
MDTLRTLRAKESDAMLQKEYDQHWEEYRNKLSVSHPRAPTAYPIH